MFCSYSVVYLIAPNWNNFWLFDLVYFFEKLLAAFTHIILFLGKGSERANCFIPRLSIRSSVLENSNLTVCACPYRQSDARNQFTLQPSGVNPPTLSFENAGDWFYPPVHSILNYVEDYSFYQQCHWNLRCTNSVIFGRRHFEKLNWIFQKSFRGMIFRHIFVICCDTVYFSNRYY